MGPEPPPLEPVLRLEVAGVRAAGPCEIQVAALGGHGVNVVHPEDVNGPTFGRQPSEGHALRNAGLSSLFHRSARTHRGQSTSSRPANVAGCVPT